MFARSLLPALLLCMAGALHAAEAQVAVAANFAEPIKAIGAVLEKTTGHKLQITVGATGRLYAQIRNGAPFDVLLSADTKAPAQLESDGLVQPGSRFTYATGKLVLWSADATRVDARGAVLKTDGFRKLALANPKTAPYGAAAVEVIDKLGLTSALTPKLVQGESIGQAYNFAHTGNAEIAFVALSQVLEGGRLKSGSMWVVPQGLYAPIRQDAVLLKTGAGNEAARALMTLLQSPNIKTLIRSYGYEL
ncbi:molybdate ABC transporter substrate-binding protein [Hydrogenophaga sp. PBL-H3]|uniref:molybdate ABC transporter substrate-binding protein n=1 Tax=Hydrogenophaga sp. PBL-H3 TaxID=434010 RepID=UPI00131FB92C|nr:molybdate ABC transporter substrate-binding protein [Hydrogenophaga sp. PBL-H3]QHE77160.1 molybdate ABC transporter substrate-binding protein [Hydrogenophaga sp. PBL-H3]QHE81584.1 molybdate ABC transporter substrate-binding protein [Hydrogenophaga sp. PBL-H3]